MAAMRAPWIATLAQRYAQCFPVSPTWRTIGREAEFPVVRSDNGDWADVHWLLRTILEHGGPGMRAAKEQGPKRRSFMQERLVKVTDEATGTQWTAEVGGGTVEVITGPCQDLHELKEKHENGVKALLRAAAAMGPPQRVLGVGMQPFSPPTRELVIDRQR